jgi:hypothetical protein
MLLKADHADIIFAGVEKERLDEEGEGKESTPYEKFIDVTGRFC